MTVETLNLRTGERRTYDGLTPRVAVICSYAQEHGDWNTWDYEKRWGSQVKEGQQTYSLGDWAAVKLETRQG